MQTQRALPLVSPTSLSTPNIRPPSVTDRVWEGQLSLKGRHYAGVLPCTAERLSVPGRPGVTSSRFWPPLIELRSVCIVPGDSVIDKMRANNVQWAVCMVGKTAEADYRLSALAYQLSTSNQAIISCLPTGGRLFLFGISTTRKLLGVYEPEKRKTEVCVWSGTMVLYGFSQKERYIQVQAFRIAKRGRLTARDTKKWPKFIPLLRTGLVNRTELEQKLHCAHTRSLVRFTPLDFVESQNTAWQAAANWMHEKNLVHEVKVPEIGRSIMIVAERIDSHSISLCGVYLDKSTK